MVDNSISPAIGINEAVAYDALLLGAKLCGETSEKVKNIELLNIVPLSLGVATTCGAFSVIIPRNTPIPTKMEHTFRTLHDNQSSFTFLVYQGERIRAKDNKLLGRLVVVVPRAPRGESKVKLVFSIDANGILICWGEEVITGLKRKIRVDKDEMRVSKEEIDKMLSDVEKYKVDDNEYKKKLFAWNALEEYIDDVENKITTLFNNKDVRLVWMADLKKMKNAIKDASQCLDRSELEDVDEYEKTTSQLENICVPILAAKLSGEISDEKVTVQLSIGVATTAGDFSVIIPRNTPIPTTMEHIYSTHELSTRIMNFSVYQGERIRAKDNKLLGTFEINVPEEGRKLAKVKVIFSMDANGVLICSGENVTTGQKREIIVANNKLRFSFEEIKEILNDVEEHQLDDNEYKKKSFARNELEEYVVYVTNTMGSIYSQTSSSEDDIIKNQLILSNICLNRSLELGDVDVYNKEKKELEDKWRPIKNKYKV